MVPDEIRGYATMDLPSYRYVMMLGQITLIPDFCRNALTWLAVYRPDGFKSAYSAVLHSRIVTSGDCQTRQFPFALWLKLYRLHRCAVKDMKRIEGVFVQIEKAHEYFIQLFSDRAEAREFARDDKEQQYYEDYEAKHPYAIGGGIHDDALMLATYGADVDMQPYGRYLAYLYFAGDVRGGV
jgi:hypothetical protein